MKLIAAIAFLALLVAFAAAESSSESQCRREMQQRSLDRCRSFMKYGRQRQSRLMTGIEDTNEDEDEMMAPQECCQQLRQTSERCRCPMIRQMMRQLMQREAEGFQGGQECQGRCGEMMMRGRFLPAMCDMEPHTCRMRQGGALLLDQS